MEAPRQEKLRTYMDLAAGELSEEALAAWVRHRLVVAPLSGL